MKKTKKQQMLYAQILRCIYTEHTVSRTDISKKTGITPATVSLITAEMITDHLIQEVGEVVDLQDKVGRKKILLSIAPSHSYYIGAEISENFFSFVLIDNTGIIIQKDTVFHSRPKPMTASFFISYLSDFISQTGYNDRLHSIGIAIPGHYTTSDKSRILTNNIYWKDFSLEEITNAFSIPVHFSNNVHCMTKAESLFYTDTETDNSNFLFFHIGRGIHCTHIYRDELYGEQNFRIGEIGHVIINPGGELCECGKHGCLQTYASETWLLHKARLLYRTAPTPHLHQLVSSEHEITLQTLLAAYELGDDMIVKLISDAVKSIGTVITNLSMILDATKIFIHGELFNSKRAVALLKNYLDFESKLFTFPSRHELIVKPHSPYTGAIGAAALSIYCSFLRIQ